MGVQDRQVRKITPNANLEMAYKRLRKDLAQASVKGERGVGARYEAKKLKLPDHTLCDVYTRCCWSGAMSLPHVFWGIFRCKRTPRILHLSSPTCATEHHTLYKIYT